MKFTIAFVAAAFVAADSSSAQMSPSVSYSSDIATQVCHACVTGVTFLNTMIGAEGEQWNEIRATMNQQCDSVPAGMMRDHCHAFVAEVDTIVTPLLADGLKPLKTCVKLGVCGHHGNSVVTALTTATGESNLGSLIEKLCHKCDALSSRVKRAILHMLSQWTTIRENLVEQCKAQETTEMQEECQQGIDALDNIVESAKQAIKDADVCNLVGCPAESPMTSLARHSRGKATLPHFHWPALRGSGPMHGMCGMCKHFSSLLEDRLEAVVNRVVSRGDEFCSTRSSPEEVEQCKESLKKMQAFYEQVAEALKDNKICFMCRDAPTVNYATIALMQLGKAGNGAEDGLCGVCETASDSVKEQVRDVIEQYHVASKTLEAKCEECPSSEIEDMCKQGLSQMDAAVEQVRAFVADSDVCSLIGCDANAVLALMPVTEVSEVSALE